MSKRARTPDGWERHFDPSHKRDYWHCPASGETRWTPPPAAPPPPKRAPPPQRASGRWEEFTDESTGRPYWHNESTGQTTWEQPGAAAPPGRGGGALVVAGGAGAVATRAGGSGLRGTVASWNDDKAFGFIRPDDGSQDIFVHRVAFGGDRRGCLIVGQPVSYQDPVPNPRGKAGSIITHKVWGPGVDPGAAPGQLTGTVAQWSADKAFGFIRPDDGTQDVFVHRVAFCGSHGGSLTVGLRVHYDEPVPNPRGKKGSIITHKVSGPGVNLTLEQ